MELDCDWLIASPSSAVLLVMGTRWTCHGPSLLVLFCYGQLLPWLRTEGYQSSGEVGTQSSMGCNTGTRQGQATTRTARCPSPSRQASSTMRLWQRSSCSFMSIQPRLCGTSSWRPPGTMSPTSPRKIGMRWCGTTFTLTPSPLALLRGLGGCGIHCTPYPELAERGKPKSTC